MKTLLKILLASMLLNCGTSAADDILSESDLKQQPWHTYEREYQTYDSVINLVIDYNLIKRIKVGMYLVEVEQITGFQPVDYYIHPDFAIFATYIDGKPYTVALLHKKGTKVLAISYEEHIMKTPKELEAIHDK